MPVADAVYLEGHYGPALMKRALLVSFPGQPTSKPDLWAPLLCLSISASVSLFTCFTCPRRGGGVRGLSCKERRKHESAWGYCPSVAPADDVFYILPVLSRLETLIACCCTHLPCEGNFPA